MKADKLKCKFLPTHSILKCSPISKTGEHWYLPEWLEELNELNEVHRAVGNHEILKALEAAFTSTVPWPAAPCPTTNKEKMNKNLS